MGFKNSSLLCLALFLACSSAIHAFDITQLLGQYSEFSTFNKYLTETKLADQINSRNTITVLAVEDSAMQSIAAKSPEAIKAIIGTHVILDFFDEKKLMEAQATGQQLTTLFQASGLAVNQQGFLKVALVGEGEIAFGSAVSNAPADATELVRTVTSEPYNISILQVTKPILAPGVDSPTPASSSGVQPSQGAKTPGPPAQDAKTPMLEAQGANPVPTQDAKAPVAAQGAKAPVAAQGAKAPVPVAQGVNPVPTQDAKAPVAAQGAKAPMPVAQGVNPVPTQDAKAPVAAQGAKAPIAAQNSKAPMSSSQGAKSPVQAQVAKSPVSAQSAKAPTPSKSAKAPTPSESAITPSTAVESVAESPEAAAEAPATSPVGAEAPGPLADDVAPADAPASSASTTKMGLVGAMMAFASLFIVL